MLLGDPAGHPRFAHWWRSSWVLALVFFLPTIVLVAGSLLFVYQSQISAQRRLAEIQQRGEVARKEGDFVAFMRGVLNDLHYIADDQVALEAMLGDPEAQTTLANNVRRLMRLRGRYDEARLFDLQGREVMHLDYNRAAPALAEPGHEDGPEDRVWLEAALALSGARVYASAVELNREHGEIEQPWKPVMHVARKIQNADGAPVGVAVLTVLVERVINEMTIQGAETPEQMLLATESGHWIVGPSHEVEWGHVLEERANHVVEEMFPGTWQRMLSASSGQFNHGRAIVTYKTLVLPPVAREGWAAGSSAEAHPLGPKILLITHVPAAYLGRQAAVWGLALSLAGLVVAVGFAAFSIYAARLTAQQFVARERLHAANTELNSRLQQVERANREIEELSSLYEDLRTCEHESELFAVLERYAVRLFPECNAGAVYLEEPGEATMYRAAVWNAVDEAAESMGTTACWAFRRGADVLTATAAEHVCRSTTNPLCSAEHLCVPLLGPAGAIGVLTLDLRGPHRPADELSLLRKLAITYSQRIAHGLLNLRLRHELQEQLIRDPLTGLFNRRYLHEVLQAEILRARRRGVALSLLMIDIDHFKQFNDTHGHDAGDAVLRAVARTISTGVRAGDIPCRFGGEELLVVLPEATLASASRRGETLRKNIEDLTLTYSGHALKVTVSVGVSAWSEDMNSQDDFIKTADFALYQAKLRGRNRVEVAGQHASGPHPPHAQHADEA